MRKIKLGVTGHRFLAEKSKLEEAVSMVICNLYERFPKLSLVILSSLAEGTDRLVVQVAFRNFTPELKVVLPVPVTEYVSDFASGDSIQEFYDLLERSRNVKNMPPEDSRESAYLSAGTYILEHCDVLVAVWDGKEELGTGGTGEIARLARESGHPIVWIHAGNRRPDTDKTTSLGEEQGKITYENFERFSE